MSPADYRPDFYDRSGLLLRCRPCAYLIDFDPEESGRDDAWLDAHVGETLPCPGCGLDSRIPTIEESVWPERKDPGDPMRGVANVGRSHEKGS
jgi:hypothetical protein